jgi:cytochrome c oxidase assembly protein subunit 11
MSASAQQSTSKGNRLIAAGAAAVVLAMIGAAYAAVPLYAAFCRATGYGGATQIAKTASALKGHRMFTVRFDANVAPGLPWSFEPETPTIQLRSGDTATIFFKAHNRSMEETAATAAYNVSPGQFGVWFDKISCFCFTEQHLGPGESAEWPVVFFLDPRLEQDSDMRNVDSVTLSYTLLAPPASTKLNAAAPLNDATRSRL